VEIAAQIVRPQRFPQSENIGPLKFPLVPYEEHSEEEEEICRVGGLKVNIQLRVHKLDEMVKCEKLFAHTGLVAKEVSFLF